MRGMTIEAYQTWRDSRLFAVYLNLKIQRVYSEDEQKAAKENEMEKVIKVMMDRPLPKKIEFYKSIADLGLRKEYKENFLSFSALFNE